MTHCKIGGERNYIRANFFFKFLRVSLANHHSTIAPYSSVLLPTEVSDTPGQAAHCFNLHLSGDPLETTEENQLL
jgi:hypothetical protein